MKNSTTVLHSLLSDPDVGRYRTDEPDQFVVGRHADPAVPLGLPARRRQCPAKEVNRVVKAEQVVVILHVILVEQGIEF